MPSFRIADIHRPVSTDVKGVEPSITNIEHLSSYNWIESPIPTIAVPGCPPLWSPPKSPKKVDKDSGLIYVAQNAARYPERLLEPLFRSLFIENPSYDIHAINLITDRNNIRKLLAFINPSLSKHRLEPFTIEVEATNDTAIFCRAETKAIDIIKPHQFKDYSHEFEKAFTTSQIAGSTGHHRIISYDFSGLKIIVRYETDAYIEPPRPQHLEESENEDLLNIMSDLSLAQPAKSSYIPAETRLGTMKQDKKVPVYSTLKIKTRVLHKPIRMQEISDWEKGHADDLGRLVKLIKDIIEVVKENEGSAVLKHDGRRNHLEVWTRSRSKMLPADLYPKFDQRQKIIQAINSGF
ncbi:hypothetical protein BO71DRAFT_472081 [Aspergillus ellipticus CBS 707.79]|uniref:Geranylgeranyl pyrophosphate synthetase n=1 Tax=Aspergillus ellipticus CBS 707.79 TaxID=1448320 RepID=A0A319CYP6_9EURO|nr:hypothetical protein BO71DRAFT_472081 [Aspergillus ellipticus CBS 707.79]